MKVSPSSAFIKLQTSRWFRDAPARLDGGRERLLLRKGVREASGQPRTLGSWLQCRACVFQKPLHPLQPDPLGEDGVWAPEEEELVELVGRGSHPRSGLCPWRAGRGHSAQLGSA